MSIDFSELDADNVLLRIVLWELPTHADSLARYLRSSGRPFVRRSVESLRRPTGAEGTIPIELFVLPISIRSLLRLLNRSGRSPVGSAFCAEDLPVLSLFRRRPPRDPNEPHREFIPYMKVLPQWCAAEESNSVISLPRGGASLQ